MSRLYLLGREVKVEGKRQVAGQRDVAGQRRKARSRAEPPQDRSTRQSSSFFAPDRSYPATPEIKRVPQLLFHPHSKELAIGEARAEASLANTVARLPQRGAPRRGVSEVSLTMTAPSAPSAVSATMEIGRV